MRKGWLCASVALLFAGSACDSGSGSEEIPADEGVAGGGGAAPKDGGAVGGSSSAAGRGQGDATDAGPGGSGAGGDSAVAWKCTVPAVKASTQTADTLIYHRIMKDASGKIVPWYSSDPATAYDHGIKILFDWWMGIEKCTPDDCPSGDALCASGVPYYMLHQVWRPEHDARGLGGDQLNMALSSWNLLYGYTGEQRVVNNMVYLASFTLAFGMSPSSAAWPDLPFPYNTAYHSVHYDGDMRAGPGILQPDKGGSFGAELVVLYKMTGDARYLTAATKIADSLSSRVVAGDEDNSPLPFRIHYQTGSLGGTGQYTTNWTGTLRLLSDLIALGSANAAGYRSARDTIIAWLKAYPLRTNKWGPFFEDITGWSDTQINAVTLALYILDNAELWGSTAAADARTCLDWAYTSLGNADWQGYGVSAINEQTAYQVPGNSHTSRQASTELRYTEMTGDTAKKEGAVRSLSWATYMVDTDGKNRYPQDDIWLTDGYGDYIRHFLRAMAAAPELAPACQDHLLRSSSVVTTIAYAKGQINYTTFDKSSRELLRIGFEPASVQAGEKPLPRLSSPSALDAAEGYTFDTSGAAPGAIRIRHDAAANVRITAAPQGTGAP